MFLTPPKGGALFIEALELRIAPAALYALANNPADSANPHYITYQTAPSAAHLGFVSGATYGVAGSNVHALKLTAGEELLIFNPATGYNFSNPFLKDTSGTLIAFFQDKNNDGQVEANELTGISLAANTVAEVNGNVNGDIVTNLTKAGKITLDSVGTFKQTIGGLNIVGDVEGSIISGGNINNVTVTGTVEDVLAGTAVGGAVYHFGDPAISTGTLHAAPLKAGVVGASINNTSFNALDVVRAGRGGLGAAGGSVSGLTLQSDTSGFDIFSGPGGRGNAKHHAGGGGDIGGVTVKGVVEMTANSPILLQAGIGGPDLGGQAGAGGSIADVAIGFDTPANPGIAPQISAVPLEDNILLRAGNGALGKSGGAGGSVSDAYLFGSIPADTTGTPEIEATAGNGGAAANPGLGHGGVGGGVSQVTAENLDTDAAAAASAIVIAAGNGGTGSAGGSVNGLTAFGTVVSVQGGNGGNGPKGGAGGSLNTVTLGNNAAALTTPPQVFTTNLTLNAGTGGSGGHGAGGNGGDITAVTASDSALASLVINSGTHANGGVGSGGLGGDGGSVTGMTINDSQSTALGSVAIRTGKGGNGFLGGGAGGDLGGSQSAINLIGNDFSYNVSTGAGGDVTPHGHGVGGAGGDLNTVGLVSEPISTTVNPLSETGTATSGAGGSGSTGGRGGDMDAVDLSAASNISLLAGKGGNGRAKAAGAGGSISGSAEITSLGSASAVAGNAGGGGNGPGAGGAVTGLVASAENNVTIMSGIGTFGGAGGDISSSGDTLNEVTGESNIGSLTVIAGRGSSANGKAGAGGSINDFNGLIGQSGETIFRAGAGGGGAHKAASGAGGSINGITLTGADGVAANQVFVTFDAGDAGVAGAAKSGATGGGVSNVTLSNLALGTIVQHVAAGDGGDVAGKGGRGGSVSQIHVGAPGDMTADIGIRSGLAYGYAIGTAGGIFAGVGGTGKTHGTAGDVTDITAAAISSIAAGKSATPHLAALVDGIDLDGLVATVANANGSFQDFGTANLVGSVINPAAAAASTYRAGDGLIAAVDLTTNRNFVPEAEETFNPSGKLVLIDYRQPSRTPVITTLG